MKKLYLHIGPHKTASTYVQKIFLDNRDVLDKKGIVYPVFSDDYMYGHHRLVGDIKLNRKNGLKEKMEYLKKVDKDIFLSSENFENLNHAEIKQLSSFLVGYDIYVIFVKRRVDDLLISNWQESIKHGGEDSWLKFFFDHMNRPLMSEIINPSKVLDLYADVFGKDKIKTIDYDYALEEGVDLCDLVCEVIDQPTLKGMGSQKKINTSLSFEEVEIIRMMNILYSKKNKCPAKNIARSAYAKFENSHPKDPTLLELKNLINQSMMPIILNDTFLIQSFHHKFFDNFGSSIVNYREKDKIDIMKQKVMNLPSDNWHIDTKAMAYLNILYKDIFEK